MGTMSLFTLGAASINGTMLEGIQNHSLNPGIDLYQNRGGGAIDPSFVAGRQMMSVASITATDVADVLTICGGLKPAALSSTAVLWFFKKVHGAAFSSSSDHVSLTINDGIVVPRRISASHKGEATVELDVLATWDGSNAPYVYAAASMPASSQVVGSKYTLGPIKLGSSYYQCQSWEIDTNMQIFHDGHSGEPFPRLASVIERDIRATITTRDLALIDTVGETGSSQTSATLWLRKLTRRSLTPVAEATSEHISFVFGSAFAYNGTVRADVGGEATQEIILCSEWNGTDEPCVVDTTAAIVSE